MFVLVIVYIVLCLGVGYLGIDRKMGFWGYFFFALFFSPILALLMVLVSDRRAKPPDPPSPAQVSELILSNALLRDDLKEALEANRRLLERMERERAAGPIIVEKPNVVVERPPQ